MEIQPVLALTPVQRGMVFHHLVDPRSGVDIEQLVTHAGPVDPDRLAQAWRALVAHHPVLRRHPAESADGAYGLRLHDGEPAALAVSDAVSVEALLEADRARGFDLLHAPPVRLTLLPHATGAHVVLTVHHVLLDGRSFPAVLVDLWDAYDALVAGTAPELPLRGEAADHLEALARRDTAAALAYWRELLAGIEAPTAFPEREATGAPSWQRVELDLGDAQSEALIAVARAHGVGLHVLVQAAWATALARRVDADRVVFGAVRAGRGPAGGAAHQALGSLITSVPVRAEIGARSAAELLADLAAQHRAARTHEHVALAAIQGATRLEGSDALFRTLVVYDRDDLDAAVRALRPAWTGRRFELHERTPYPVTLYAYGETRLRLALAFDGRLLPADDAARLLRRVATIAAAIAAAPQAALHDLDLLLPEEHALLARAGSGPSLAVDGGGVVEQFERCAARHPERAAVCAAGQRLRYAEAAARVDALAGRLAAAGAGAGSIVGLSLDRCADLPLAMLAVLRAGAAYLPLDPEYPADRLAYCLRDSGAALVLTQARHAARFAGSGARVLCVDEAPTDTPAPPAKRPAAQDLAYLIYTSGSTGQPKGVQVTHANVANFFAGMDARIRCDGEQRWLAVTSPSFDISVLELLWTLCRGFEVVVHGARAAAPAAAQGPSFSLFHFASGFDVEAGDPYHLIREAARFADDNGFEAIWSPERHFHAFGAPYPSPAVMNAALAAMTRRVKLRAGSVVLPLHDPFRVAEDWALVDRLSDGRVGISFAAGWQPNDFVLAPQNYERRKDLMFEQLESVRTLWRGGKLTVRNPRGDEVALGTYPRPVQAELPVWITAAGSPDTFARAGACGANILTHLLGQTPEELGRNIDTWRRAREAAGFDPATGRATVMVHTFLGEDTEQVRALVREPLKRYLRSAAGLVGAYADAWTAFKQGAGAKVDGGAIDQLSPEQKDELYEFAFTRYFESSGLFGTPERALPLVEALRRAGADEIACLIDFGVDSATVVAHLPWIARLREASARGGAAEPDLDVVRDLATHGITHLQCTPSLARMVPMLARGGDELASLRELLVGGEALPPDLARELHARLHPDARILNMYGPTETTVWSTVAEVPRGATRIAIGTPIANTGCHVVDSRHRPVPPGQAGELLISGAGVTRGYHQRPELTASRFVELATAAGTVRAYATGDLARLEPDGSLSCLGRTDFQIKVRGHRIEPGEIEARLRELPGVHDAVVVARDDSVGTRQLVAYVSAATGAPRPQPVALRERLRELLPEHLVPDACVVLDALPLTPNGKVDRKALPDPRAVRADPGADATQMSEAERSIHDIWCRVLGLPAVGRHDNFFELGGHSILAVKVQAELAAAFGRRLPIVELFRAPTLAALAARFAGEATPGDGAAQRGSERAQLRRAARARRGAGEAEPR